MKPRKNRSHVVTSRKSKDVPSNDQGLTKSTIKVSVIIGLFLGAVGLIKNDFIFVFMALIQFILGASLLTKKSKWKLFTFCNGDKWRSFRDIYSISWGDDL